MNIWTSSHQICLNFFPLSSVWSCSWCFMTFLHFSILVLYVLYVSYYIIELIKLSMLLVYVGDRKMYNRKRSQVLQRKNKCCKYKHCYTSAHPCNGTSTFFIFYFFPLEIFHLSNWFMFTYSGKMTPKWIWNSEPLGSSHSLWYPSSVAQTF